MGTRHIKRAKWGPAIPIRFTTTAVYEFIFWLGGFKYSADVRIFKECNDKF